MHIYDIIFLSLLFTACQSIESERKRRISWGQGVISTKQQYNIHIKEKIFESNHSIGKKIKLIFKTTGDLFKALGFSLQLPGSSLNLPGKGAGTNLKRISI